MSEQKSKENCNARILPQNSEQCQSSNWKALLAQSTQQPCAAHPNLTPAPNIAASQSFPMKIPHRMAALIDPNDPHDPLLQQVLPQAEEDIEHVGFSQDPTADLAQQPIPGLLHKYFGRVLLVTTGACAIHCRYCFRRHYPYAQQQTKPGHWQSILAYLRDSTDVSEVILSGGDPLTLADEKLLPMLRDLQSIPHIHTIRFHTRMLTFIPERVSGPLKQWISNAPQQVVMVYHINHGNELNPPFAKLTQTLQQLNVTQLNQSVLLKQVNNQVSSLVELSHALFKVGILPYYLHQLDPVQGAAHFQVPLAEAKALHMAMKNQLPGYLVPKLVFEAPQAQSKQWLC